MSPFLDETDAILAPYRDKLGADHAAYRHHVWRVIALGRELAGTPTADQNAKLVIAACFHDLGIWTEDTFDYIDPSVALAGNYLDRNGLSPWREEIERMIREHHKLTVFRDSRFPLVEIFRRADWIDVSLGLLTFGLSRTVIRNIRREYPNAGFHKKLLWLTAREFRRHPLSPLPMFKW